MTTDREPTDRQLFVTLMLAVSLLRLTWFEI